MTTLTENSETVETKNESKAGKGREPRLKAEAVRSQDTGSLSVVISQNALADLRQQRSELMSFIKSCLVEDVDFGEVPGTNTSKPSLYKPGAEKLANLFKLGSRIVTREREIDFSKQWAMFSYVIEVFHIPTGATVAQCEGSANSQERKYKSRPAAEMLNMLQKMAQKRAYVGAVIIATGASDFFTQDIEDMDPATFQQNRSSASRGVQHAVAAADGEASESTSGDPGEFVCTFGKYRDLHVKDIDANELNSYVTYIRKKAAEEAKPIRGQVKEFIEAAESFLHRPAA